MNFPQPIYWLFILAIPVACIAWTVTDLKNDGLDSKLKESELKKCEELS